METITETITADPFIAGQPADEAASIAIQKVAQQTIRVPILGVTPLLMHRFSEKAKRQMLDNMQGRKSLKESKDPQAEYESSFYRLTDGTPGFPVIAFKSATIGAARFYGKEVTMTALKQYMFFQGEIGSDGQTLSRIEGDPQMREDVVRIGRGTDLRYRAEFRDWRTVITVTYVTSALTQDSILSLIDAGGMGVGVGEWRPEKNGDRGTYMIDPDRAVEVIG